MTPDQLRVICDANAIAISLTGFVRESDAAQLLDVSVRTLRDWRRCGIGPACVRMGGWRYALADLADALTPSEASDEIRQEPEDCDSDESADEPHPVIVQKAQVA